jgi:triacylglycerol lipase
LLQIYELLKRFGLKSGAFAQLTTSYMQETFNPANPDDPDVRYYSYGASATPNPWQIWYFPYKLISEKEGENDGMVSVSSARWGDYKGTLMGPTHLDIINWTNRLQWVFKKRT